MTTSTSANFTIERNLLHSQSKLIFKQVRQYVLSQDFKALTSFSLLNLTMKEGKNARQFGNCQG